HTRFSRDWSSDVCSSDLALGVLLVLVSGGIDVSFPAVAVVSAYLAILTVDRTGIDSLWLALAVSIAIGILLGAFNALLIHFLKRSEERRVGKECWAGRDG